MVMLHVAYFPQCRLSNLRTGYVVCHSTFNLKLPNGISLSPMWHVEFKKCPCRPVGFRGSRAIRRTSWCFVLNTLLCFLFLSHFYAQLYTCVIFTYDNRKDILHMTGQKSFDPSPGQDTYPMKRHHILKVQ